MERNTAPPVQSHAEQEQLENGHEQQGRSLAPPAFSLSASAPTQLKSATGPIQRSSWSEKLAKIYKEQGRDAYFAELRKIKVCDQDVLDWIKNNLIGDDQWLATKIADWGDEKKWPIHLQVELQMRPFPGCRGADGAKDILRNAAGAEAQNAALTKSIYSITHTKSIERWMLLKLQELGSEANFSKKDLMMKWYLDHNELTVPTEIEARNLNVFYFDKAFDKWWIFKDGSKEVKDISDKLRGNTEGLTIRINSALSIEQSVAALYHEVQHHVVGEQNLPELDEEVEVRVKTEEMMITNGLDETKPGYRTPDGKVDRSFIDKDVKTSTHYNPKDRKRIGRWYEGELRTGSWILP